MKAQDNPSAGALRNLCVLTLALLRELLYATLTHSTALTASPITRQYSAAMLDATHDAGSCKQTHASERGRDVTK